MASRKRNIDKESSNIDEEQLWQQLKEGDREAFVWIYNKYVADLIRYGCQIVKDKSLVEDVVQDIFVALWEKKKDQADVYSIKFYLLSATRRTLIRRIKKENIFVSEQDEPDRPFKIAPSFLDEKLEILEEQELTEKIRTVIESLSDRQREIIYLKFYQGLSYKEIAALLELDQKYTYNLAARAYNSFKEKFELFIITFFMMLLHL